MPHQQHKSIPVPNSKPGRRRRPAEWESSLRGRRPGDFAALEAELAAADAVAAQLLAELAAAKKSPKLVHSDEALV